MLVWHCLKCVVTAVQYTVSRESMLDTIQTSPMLHLRSTVEPAMSTTLMSSQPPVSGHLVIPQNDILCIQINLL